MKIYIKSSTDSQAYLPLIVKALQDAGHEVRHNAMVRNDSAGKQSSDLYLELSAGGLHQLSNKATSTIALVPPKVDFRIEKLVLVIGKSVLPRRAIVDGLHLRQKSRAIFSNNYLKPAIAKGYVTMTCPDHPNLPEQAYRLTANGLDLYKELTLARG